MATLIHSISQMFKTVEPEVVYFPYPGDVHTDHQITFNAVNACCKSFRYPSIKRGLVYETLSETEFNLDPDVNGFRPNVFIDISDFLEEKLEIMQIYSSELGTFPFPRSEEAIRALATVRGAVSGFQAAEAFMLLK